MKKYKTTRTSEEKGTINKQKKIQKQKPTLKTCVHADAHVCVVYEATSPLAYIIGGGRSEGRLSGWLGDWRASG